LVDSKLGNLLVSVREMTRGEKLHTPLYVLELTSKIKAIY